ncbi:MAG: thioredoxin-disulfide reductase [Bacilli bacterium]|nr:thioredoxin-disulfide reductase [Bacilli bacterium]
MYDIIIVGAGPAGLTAAIYALRGNKKVLVLEGKTYGGQIVNAAEIENYPGIPSISGFDYATALYNQVTSFGGEIQFEAVTKIDKDKSVTTSNGTYQAKSIIIATGAENRRLGVPREAEFIGKGLSYCATCDGNFYKKKTVAVVGGGNTALEDAIYLSNIAEKVYLIHRRDTFRGEDTYVEELKQKENVEFILNSNVVELNGTERLESIVVDTNGERNTIDVNGLFIAVGQAPKNEIFANVVELVDGYIKSDDGVHTLTDGIYVAGDTRVKELRQLTTAVSDGAIAATTAMKEMK